jgi:hypothetical protein
MDHGLLVSPEYVAEVVAVLVESLGHSSDVPMPEDAEATLEEAPSFTIPLGLLGLDESDQGLGGGQTLCSGGSHGPSFPARRPPRRDPASG